MSTSEMPRRKPGRPTNAERERRRLEAERATASSAGNSAPAGQVIQKEKTDAELLSDIQFRFKLMGDMTRAVIRNDIRSFIVSGAPGMSKTFTIEGILESAADEENKKIEIIKGFMTPISLYKAFYRNRTTNDILLLDDVDIFKDEVAIAIGKAAFDTSPIRRISWMSETNALKEENIPPQFNYHGGAIFITNTDMQGFVDHGVGKAVPHMKALIDRSAYLDLNLHARRSQMVWIRYIAETYKILETQVSLTSAEAKMILDWMAEHRDDFRDLSLRVLIKAAQNYKLDESKLNWKRVNEMMLFTKEAQSR